MAAISFRCVALFSVLSAIEHYAKIKKGSKMVTDQKQLFPTSGEVGNSL
jgi:hypothetical protein